MCGTRIYFTRGCQVADKPLVESHMQMTILTRATRIYFFSVAMTFALICSYYYAIIFTLFFIFFNIFISRTFYRTVFILVLFLLSCFFWHIFAEILMINAPTRSYVSSIFLCFRNSFTIEFLRLH